MKFIITEQQYFNLFENNYQNNPLKERVEALLMTGIVRDKSHEGQVQDFKNGFGENKNIRAFKHSDVSGLLSNLKKYPNIPVVLFSWGAINAGTIASEMTNKSNLYIVEPWGKGDTSPPAVISAVNQGVPSENVFVGPNIGRGLGVIKGKTSKTPQGLNHFQALQYVGSLLK